MPTLADLVRCHDPKDAQTLVAERLAECASPATFTRFMYRYAHWNGFFGPGVAHLSGKIGRARNQFIDPDEPLKCTADRSMVVASYFFDAARDEFDDRETGERDPHRSLAQATLKGLVQWAPEVLDDPNLFQVPLWLQVLCDKVADGYGLASNEPASVFRAMGYHLGSELMADTEFSAIDRHIQTNIPGLYGTLGTRSAQVGDEAHPCYAWIRIHSGQGGAVEADHFARALRGVDLALRYAGHSATRELEEQVLLGYTDFVLDHSEFFDRVNRA